jgi:hypothetical protein
LNKSELDVLNRVSIALELLKQNTKKKKLSEALKAWWRIPENKERALKSMRTPEHRKKMSEVWMAYYANPDNHQQIEERRQDPVYRRKLSAAVKTSWDTGLLWKYRRLRKRKRKKPKLLT